MSRVILLGAAVAVLMTSANASAQKLQLDVETLLTSKDTLSTGFTDNVWAISVPQHRQLIIVPVRPTNITQPLELSEGMVDVSGSRLIGWFIPPEEFDFSGTGKMAQAGEKVTVGDRTLDLSLPRITRDVVLNGDGTVTWKMPRALLNGTPNVSNMAYGLRIDRSGLKRPEQPRINQRRSNESVAQFAVRRNAELAQFRKDLQTYVQTNKLLSNLPTEFSQPMPDQIWAVFDGSVLIKDLVISGKETSSWSVPYETFKLMQTLAGGGGDNLSLERVVGQLVPAGDPVSLRAAALVISAGKNLTKLSADSPALPHIEQLLTKADSRSKVLVAQAVARNPGQTPIAAKLLDSALANPDPQVVLLGLKGKLSEQKGAEPDPATLQTLTQTVNALLSSADGPAPHEVLQVCVDLVATQPVALEPLARQVRVADTHSSRLDDAVRFVVANAIKSEPLSVRWIGDQLLLPAKPDIAQRTVQELLAVAEPIADTFKDPMTGLAMNHPTHGLLQMLEVTEGPMRQLAVSVAPLFRVPIANEGVEEPQQAILFDQIVKATLLTKPTPRNLVELIDRQVQKDLKTPALAKIVAGGDGPARLAAMQRWRTGVAPDIDASLRKIPGEQRAAAINFWYESAAADGAAADKPLPGFAGLAGHLIDQWVARSAENDTTAPPPVIDVLRHEDVHKVLGTLLTWLSAEIAAGRRPHPRLWYENFGDQRTLISAATSKSPETARGARAVLIASVAWPSKALLDQFDQRFQAEISGDVASDFVVQAETVWTTMRVEITTDLIARVPGNYRATVLVQPAKPVEGGPPVEAASLEPVEYDLGVITLTASGSGREFTTEQTEFALTVSEPNLTLDTGHTLASLADKLDPKPAIDWPTRGMKLLPGRGHSWVMSWGGGLSPAYTLRLQPVAN